MGTLACTSQKGSCSIPKSSSSLNIKGKEARYRALCQRTIKKCDSLQQRSLDALLMFEEGWQITVGGFTEQILHHLPSHALLNFLSRHPMIFPVRCKLSPIPNVQVIFTDRSARGRASIVTTDQNRVIHTQEISAQRAELTAVIEAFIMFAEKEFNPYSNSQYMVRLFPHIETAVLPETKSTVFYLLPKLQQQIWNRNQAFYIGHIRAHSGLQSPLNALNDLADSLTRITVASVIEKARASRPLHHQNSQCLFSLPHHEPKFTDGSKSPRP